MYNNYDVQMDREINNASVSVREFANDNNIGVMNLRGFLRYDNTIKPAFTRGSTNYYKLELLTNWLKRNKNRFDGFTRAAKPVTRDFYCTSCGDYPSIDLKSKKFNCCMNCEKKATAAKLASVELDKSPNTNKIITPALRLKHRVDDMNHGRELKQLASVDNWMNEF